MVVAILLNLVTGLLVHRWPARWFIVISSFLCALSPLMMALVPPGWNYWYLEFWAQIFAPLSLQVLYTIGLIIVSSNFPQETQALAGAVFSTVGTFGSSFGIGMCQLVALGVMDTAGDGNDKEDGNSEGSHGGAFSGYGDAAALEGFRAAFWTMSACMVAVGLLAVYGLRKTGKVGVKRE
jgi:MFS family permease